MMFSFLGSQTGLWLFIHATYMFYFFSVVTAFMAVYLGISIFVNIMGSQEHLDLLAKRMPSDEELPEIDVFLPCCGEPVSVLRNTYQHVRDLDWPVIHVHVLDDGAKESVRRSRPSTASTTLGATTGRTLRKPEICATLFRKPALLHFLFWMPTFVHGATFSARSCKA
ncbi:hypothetical protein DFJ73DRAFT_812737 [Zopfochytrium polystomum]|nr:hypothetical protein DFJ73DRAFT_812737 [Zopfochytrium polystomum]